MKYFLSFFALIFLPIFATAQFAFLDTTLTWDLKSDCVGFYPFTGSCTEDAGSVRLKRLDQYPGEEIYEIVTHSTHVGQGWHFMILDGSLYLIEDLITWDTIYFIMEPDNDVGDQIGYIGTGGISYHTIAEIDSIYVEDAWQKRYIIPYLDTLIASFGPMNNALFFSGIDCSNTVEFVTRNDSLIYEFSDCPSLSVGQQAIALASVYFAADKLIFSEPILTDGVLDIYALNGKMLRRLDFKTGDSQLPFYSDQTGICIVEMTDNLGYRLKTQLLYVHH